MSVYTKKTAADRRYERYIASQLKSESAAADLERREAEFDPTLGMNLYDKIMAGTFSGMKESAYQVGNIAGLVDDSSLADLQKLHAPLHDTTAGAAGKLIGEAAITAPIGGLVAKTGGAIAGGIAPQTIRQIAPWLRTGTRYGTEGAVEGAIAAGPDHRGEGAVLGGMASPVIGGAGNLATRTNVGTPNARLLMDEGVDLTPGQMNPRGMMSAIEQSSPARLTPSVAAQRNQGTIETFGAMINRSLPPGGTPVNVTNVQQMTEDLHGMFNRNYDQVRDFPANTKGLVAQMDDRISTGGGIDSIQESDTRWLADKMTAFDPADMTTGDLMNLRSTVRTRMRDRFREGTVESVDAMRALEGVEDAITQRIERALPNRQRRLLNETDAQYGNYKTIEDISWRSGDSEGVTPNRMTQSVKKSADSKGTYARGGGGPLRDLSRAANEVFSMTTPPTGMSNLVPGALSGLGTVVGGLLGGVPGGGIGGLTGAMAPAGIAAAGVSPLGKALYAGRTLPQDVMRNIASIPIVPEFLRALGSTDASKRDVF